MSEKIKNLGINGRNRMLKMARYLPSNKEGLKLANYLYLLVKDFDFDKHRWSLCFKETNSRTANSRSANSKTATL